MANERDKWNYFENSDDCLLRFLLSDDKKTMTFQVLNTKTVSEKNIMYYNDYINEDLIEDLEVKQDFDIYTYLNTLFETKPPELIFTGINEEYVLKITKNDGTPYKIALKREECKDKQFLERNIQKKLKRIKRKMDVKFKEINGENEKLNKRNEELKKELELIKKENEKLSKDNEEISTALKELKETQEIAIGQLQKLIN